MMKVRKKDISGYINTNTAINADTLTDGELYAVRKSIDFTQVCYSVGVYGVSGLVVYSMGKYYATNNRGSALFILLA